MELPRTWARRVAANPERWAQPALERFGETVFLRLEPPNTDPMAPITQVVITASPRIRDLAQSDTLSNAVPTWADPMFGFPGAPQCCDGAELFSSRRIASAALDPLLSPVGQAVLSDEVARATRIIRTVQNPEAKDFDLRRLTRSVFYRTAIRVLSGASDDRFNTLPRLAGLCDTIAEHPINPVTHDAEASEYALGAAAELRASWRAFLLGGDGVVPNLYRAETHPVIETELGALSPAQRESYFSALMSALILGIEPVARAAATTLDHCLRTNAKLAKPEYPGCIRRSPPVPFFVREQRRYAAVPLAPNLTLYAGDRVLFHVPTMFDLDPHAPYHDAFGIGAHRCIGSAIAVTFLRNSLEPLYGALCSAMAAPLRRAERVRIDPVVRDKLREIPEGSSVWAPKL